MALEKSDTTVINQSAPASTKIVRISAERLSAQQPCIAMYSDDEVLKCPSKSGIAAVTPDGQDTYSGNSILGKRNLSQRDKLCVQPCCSTDDVHTGISEVNKELCLVGEGEHEQISQSDIVMDEFDHLVSSSEVVFDFEEPRNTVTVRNNEIPVSLHLDSSSVMSHVETEQQDMLQALEQSLVTEVSYWVLINTCSNYVL